MSQKSYTVLARRYRPIRLDDLVGQELLQKTLTEAINQNHLPHAILLHGIRGVGKTTTARIIARALNCVGADGNGSITPNPCGVCASCKDIQDDRHLDVIEMDAASRTGVDDIREVIESARYKAVKGRFKIFIIDEVHMLSKSAFNALLKTLEEPPAHVKFIFATTEIRKIPDTILSRCMRFDLKRIEPAIILAHLAALCAQEGITASNEALGLIARAGDGSMRDALSLLDQAIALSLSNNGDGITEERVREMLGATARDHIFTLLTALFKGDAATLLTLSESLFLDGADPLLLLQEILESIYWLTCLKTMPKMKEDATWSKADREQGLAIIEGLGLAALARAWQVLSKGYEEVQKNPLPKQACQMVFVRFCHLSTLPPLEKIIESASNRSMGGGDGQHTQTASSTHSTAPIGLNKINETTVSVPVETISGKTISADIISGKAISAEITSDALIIPDTFEGLVHFLHEKREILLATHLENEARVTAYRVGEITMNLDTNRFGQLPAQLRKMLHTLTNIEWTINVTSALSGTTLIENREAAAAAKISQAKENPFLAEFLKEFPHSTLTLMEPEYARN